MASAAADRTPNEIGEDLEAHARTVLGMKRTPGSGNGRFVKLDGFDAAKFIYSCKASTTLRDAAMRAIAKLWREAVHGSRGYNGHGNDAKPAMIFECDGEVLILMRLDDHAALATGEIPAYIQPSKGAERRNKASANPRDA